MRRILRKIAENDFGSLGDTSTLADPALVDADRGAAQPLGPSFNRPFRFASSRPREICRA